MPSDLRGQLESHLGDTYHIERELGGGGMSRVFVAEETRLRRKVVIKVLSPDLAAGVSAGRFERELQLAASLQQANIVPVLSAGEVDGLAYYTMPFVDGESLRTRIARGDALSIGEVVSTLRDVARALAYAHGHGVVHRDIKPDNVLVSGGTAVVTDFGIAKALAAAGQASRETGGTLTQLGTSVGTPAYMAPEQVAGDPDVDHRADFYALGCMAYELLAGASPFANRTPQQMLVAHMAEEPRRLTDLRADTPPALSDLVARCMAKDPAHRPQTAGAIAQVLEAVATGGSLDALPTLGGGQPSFGRALLVYGAAGVGVLAVAIAAELAIGLPAWVLQATLAVVLAGFLMLLAGGLFRRGATTQPRWNRLARMGVSALGVFVVLVAGYLVLAATGFGPGASLLASGRMSTNARLLVADFRVVSGPDTLLGGVVSEALRTDLGQSRVVSVVSPTEVSQALQRMQQAPDTRIDSAVAREIAEREGFSAIVDGTITPLSTGTYIMVARLRAAEDGAELASFRETAEGADIIEATERLARSLREEIGESLKDVRASPALGQVTTGSLEALRKYAAGVRAAEIEVDYPKSIGLLREALAIDSTFAMAWRKLGVSLANYGMPGGDSAATRAYELRHRLTEVEAANAVGYYFQRGPGRNRAKAIEAYETVVRQGIAADGPMHNLALLVTSKREFARAESLYRRVIASGRAPAVTYGNLHSVLWSLGKIAEADSVLRLTRQLFPNTTVTLGDELIYFYHRGQLDSAEALVAGLRDHPDPRVRSAMWYSLSSVQFLRGRLNEGFRSHREGRRIDSARGSPIPPVVDSIFAAFVDLNVVGNPERAVARFERAIAGLPDDRRSQQIFFFASAGQAQRARAMLRREEAQLRDSIDQRFAEPTLHRLRGEVLMAEGKPLEAIRELRASDTTMDGPVNACVICILPSLGIAFDRAGMPDSAIATFERYFETPTPQRLNLDLDVANVPRLSRRLGELYEAKGDRQKAAAHYRRFVDLWQNADPELQPQVAEIRQRLSRLSR
jgi:tetratricopeptide (TPR) repeat protein